MADASAEPDRRLRDRWGILARRAAGHGAPQQSLSGGRLTSAFGVLGVALIALVVWAGFLVNTTHAADVRKSDLESVQSAARRVVTNFYSISYQTFDQDAQRVYADLSNKFKEQAVQQLGTSWKQSVVTNRLVSKATVATSGVINISAKSADVMVTIRRSAQSAQAKAPVSSWASVQVQLTKTGDRWLVSALGGLQ